jgi:predicted MFS family arabinose efflux permease
MPDDRPAVAPLSWGTEGEKEALAEETGLGTILLTRVNLNVPVRLSYFFLPAIGRGLGVSLPVASGLVSVNSVMGIIAPFFGTLSDRWGGRRVMALGAAFLVVGALLIAALPWYGVALVGFAFLGLSKSAYDPAMQAYLGRRVPYERRGRALGLAELAWSGSLLAMPLCGLMISRWSWRAPLLTVAVMGVLAWWLTQRGLSFGVATQVENSSAARNLFRDMGLLWRDRHVRLALLSTATLMLAQDSVMVVYGAWMEDRFGLTLSALGLATLVFGASELLAELGVALISDRLGKRRVIFFSVIVAGMAYWTLPHLTRSLGLALAGTAVLILAFEFSIVGLIPIVSGMNESSRGTLMSLNVVAASAGRMVGAPLGAALYRAGDLTHNGPVSALACLVLVGLLYQLREGGH